MPWLFLDFLIVCSAFSASYLWWLASRKRLRRISRNEVLDSADFNRIITALNRTQILNSQAALATALTTVLAGMRLILELLA